MSSLSARSSARSAAPPAPLWHVLAALHRLLLEVAVARTLGHRAHRPHAAIDLERAALEEHGLAGRLLGAGEERAHHHAVGAGGQRLDDVSGVADPPVG